MATPLPGGEPLPESKLTPQAFERRALDQRGRPVKTARRCCLQWGNDKRASRMRSVDDHLQFLEGWQSPVGKALQREVLAVRLRLGPLVRHGRRRSLPSERDDGSDNFGHLDDLDVARGSRVRSVRDVGRCRRVCDVARRVTSEIARTKLSLTVVSRVSFRRRNETYARLAASSLA